MVEQCREHDEVSGNERIFRDVVKGWGLGPFEGSPILKPPARMGFGLSSRFFIISLSLLVERKGAKASRVGLEASAKPNVVAIRSKAGPPSSSAEPGLQARIRRSAKLSTIMPLFVRAGDQGGKSKSLQRR